MIDIFDIMAFAVFAVLLAAAVVIVVGMGSLPGWIAQKRGHPQAAAINVASWLGVATLGLLWPLALIWAFLKPLEGLRDQESGVRSQGSGARDEEASGTGLPSDTSSLQQMQSRIEALEAALRSKKEGGV